MKSGICLLLLATNHDPLARAAIPTAAKAGYDYAEVSLARIYSLSDNQLSDYRSLFLQSGLPVEVFNNAVPKGLALAGPGADPQALSRYIDRALYLAGFMGVSMITMSGPNRLTVPSDQTWMDIFPSYIQFLKEYTDRAAEYGVSLVIEPINEEEHSFISTVSTAMDAVMAVNRPNLMTMIDSYHFTKQRMTRTQSSETYPISDISTMLPRPGALIPLNLIWMTAVSCLLPFLMPDIKAVSALKLTLIIQSRICRKAPGC